jgi:hypothetical protein
VGFEPTLGFPKPHFECGAFNRSATSPQDASFTYFTASRAAFVNLYRKKLLLLGSHKTKVLSVGCALRTAT